MKGVGGESVAVLDGDALEMVFEHGGFSPRVEHEERWRAPSVELDPGGPLGDAGELVGAYGGGGGASAREKREREESGGEEGGAAWSLHGSG